jgi:hypothetical protein
MGNYCGGDCGKVSVYSGKMKYTKKLPPYVDWREPRDAADVHLNGRSVAFCTVNCYWICTIFNVPGSNYR